MITTISSKVQATLDFKTNKLSQMYVGIGRTSPWSDESNPPKEDETRTSLEEVIGYKLVQNCSLVRPLKAGEDTTGLNLITYKNLTWVLVPDDKAYDESAYYLYFTVDILNEDFGTVTYRQDGVYTDLKPKEGVLKPNLTPSEIDSPGILHTYENHEPQIIISSGQAIIDFLLQA